MLLVFMVLAITVTTAAVGMVVVNSLAASRLEQSDAASVAAESGAEDALVRLLRDTTYSGGTLTVGEGSVTVTVGGQNPKTILATGTVGNFRKSVEVSATITDTVVSVVSWQEVP